MSASSTKIKFFFIIKILIVATVLFFTGLLAVIFLHYNTSKKIFKTIDLPEILYPVQFTIFGVSPDTISARFSFFSRNQNTLGQLERSWNGSNLFFDFYYIQFGEKTMYFPYRLYTNETNKKDFRTGTVVLKYYQPNTNNNLYTYADQKQKEKTSFTRIFNFVNLLNKTCSVRLPFLKENTGIKTLNLSDLTTNELYTVKIQNNDISIFSEKEYFR
ncbi:MAG: hypothetical protein ACRC4W_06735 [Treponemataceae bacterium]